MTLTPVASATTISLLEKELREMRREKAKADSSISSLKREVELLSAERNDLTRAKEESDAALAEAEKKTAFATMETNSKCLLGKPFLFPSDEFMTEPTLRPFVGWRQ